MSADGYYSENELNELGIEHGSNVLISKKSSIYSSSLAVGDNVRVDDFCILVGDIRIGSHVHIASFCQLSGSSGIIIEDFAGIASRSLLFSQSDDFSGNFLTGPLIDTKYTNVKKGRILVKKHSIVGAGSIILPSITLSEGTAVAACSLIHQNTEAWFLYGGIPAKKIKQRNQTILNLEHAFLQEYNS